MLNDFTFGFILGSEMASVLLCIYCEDQIDNFENHIATQENDDETSKCKECDLSIANFQCLETHKTLVHQKSQRIYTCERCNIDFSSKRYLLVHKDIGHKPEKIDGKEEIELEECETKPLVNESENNLVDYENVEYYNHENEITDEPNLESDEPNYELDLTCYICEKTYKSIKDVTQLHGEGV